MPVLLRVPTVYGEADTHSIGSIHDFSSNEHQKGDNRVSEAKAQAVKAQQKEKAQQIQANMHAIFTWRTLQRVVLVSIGACIAGLGYSLFQVPFSLAAGGLSGVVIIISNYVDFPEGLMLLILNIPLLILGFYTLGRWRFLSYTLLAAVLFSLSADFFTYFLPIWLGTDAVTDDMLLSSIYAGVVVGIGSGIIYRAGSTIGGTSITSRLIQRKTGLPLSQAYLYTDGAIIVASGFAFGWEIALHAFLAVFVMGMASDYVLEGPSQVRSATIITNEPQALTLALMQGLRQGASQWEITGSYTGKQRAMVWCTVSRAQVNDLKYIVANVDPDAFIVIGQSHQALGGGFLSLRREAQQ
jgi:uncharacterized membrane-anchored protein YitT (DUF2179 family)